ncbi:DUF3397 family protein [Lentilactobacillus raoultii]|uniref:DUF3397 family protein n=1 Tax=Lentilactobacillus raoultii TaxID=1987503 RepID=A0ABW3PDM1_9LACO|nr:DUF3397 family protein [Lentilactobacillus raoultii]
MQFPSWTVMTVVFLGQLVFLLLVASIMILIRKNRSIKNRFAIVPIDLWPPFLLVFIQQLSGTISERSVLPQIVIIWMTIGLVVLLWQILTDREMTYRRFFVLFWRLSDLLLVIGWLGTFSYFLFQ